MWLSCPLKTDALFSPYNEKPTSFGYFYVHKEKRDSFAYKIDPKRF